MTNNLTNEDASLILTEVQGFLMAMHDMGAYARDIKRTSLLKEIDAFLHSPAEPRAEHICGTPDAMCDVNCMERAYQNARSAVLTIKFRPLLVSGSYGESPNGAVILIDSEQSPEQQLTTLWHEVLHLVLAALDKVHDENWIETMALRFAAACPDLLTQPRATENR